MATSVQCPLYFSGYSGIEMGPQIQRGVTWIGALAFQRLPHFSVRLGSAPALATLSTDACAFV
eukprot:356523-Chlamydomonas_euryale.AAC.2